MHVQDDMNLHILHMLEVLFHLTQPIWTCSQLRISIIKDLWCVGPSSELTVSLVNNSLKFTSSDTQIC